MEVGGGGGLEIIYLSLHCHHQNDLCIKLGSDESHFNVSYLKKLGTVTKQCPQTTTSEEKGEPKRIRTEVPPLTSLTIYRQAKPAHQFQGFKVLLSFLPLGDRKRSYIRTRHSL